MVNDSISTTQNIGINIKKYEALIKISQSKSEYLKTYTLRARVCMRFVSIILPGIINIELTKD